MHKRLLSKIACTICILLTPSFLFAQGSYESWNAYGGDAGGARYSDLDQVNTANVAGLELAWSYRTGELGQNAKAGSKLTFEATPIFFENRLYVSTAYGKVICVNASSGEEIWTYDSGVNRRRSFSEVTSRGVSLWTDEEQGLASIFVATIDARLISIDARTGKLLRDFGNKGQIELSKAVGMSGNGNYQSTSPPAVVNNVVIVGSSIGDNWTHDTGSGVVRGFDVRTGRQLWSWNPVESPEEKNNDMGAANVWSVMSADPELDLVYLPTSSASPDFYGGLRPGDNRHANSLVALKASTGELVWSFQTVHHDIWDYDLAAQPVLFDFMKNGVPIPAVAQVTKMGLIFILDRKTGEPLIKVEERKVPGSDTPGEFASATQPFPVSPAPVVPHDLLTPDKAWGLDEKDRNECRELITKYRNEGPYTPPSLQGSILSPGNTGGVNWGSMSFHKGQNVFLMNTSRLQTFVQLLPKEEVKNQDIADRLTSETPYEYSSQGKAKYGMRRKTLTASSGIPCTSPPWGTLLAVNPVSGEFLWEIPFGEAAVEYPRYNDLDAQDIVGTPSSGGPISTAGNLLFIAATADRFFKAYDVETGKELWRFKLPRAGISTPMTYSSQGKQYIVISAGGHGKQGLELGDYVMAFSLPD